MDSANTPAATDDLSSLAWVHEELRKTLEQAHKHLRRYLRDVQAAEGAELDDIDPTLLRHARTQLHQAWVCWSWSTCPRAPSCCARAKGWCSGLC